MCKIHVVMHFAFVEGILFSSSAGDCAKRDMKVGRKIMAGSTRSWPKTLPCILNGQ